MKKIILLFAVLLATVATSTNVQAQHINVNINIGAQPAWGPMGYDYVDYYYMPDINVYYIVNSHSYVYLDGRRWITARYLPYRYRNYDLYGMYKVVLVDVGRDPWRYNGRHYKEYGRYRNYRGQSVIRDSRDNRYNDSRNNYSPWYRESSPNRVTSTTRPDNNGNSVRPSTSTRPNSNSGTSTRPATTTRPSSSTRESNSSGRDSNTSVRSSTSRDTQSTRSSSGSSTRSSSNGRSTNSSSRR